MKDKNLKLNVDLLPYQDVLFKENQVRYLGCPGGVGAGKTVLKCRWLIYKMSQHPKKRSWFTAHTNRTVKHVCMNKYLEEADTLGFREGRHFSVNKSEQFVKWANGHTTFFLSAEAWQSWVGEDLVAAVGDECGRWPEEAKRELDERLRDKTEPPQMLLGGAPQGRNWYMEMFTGPDFEDDPNAVLKGKSGNSVQIVKRKENCVVIHFPTFLNHHLPDSYWKSLWDSYGHDRAIAKAHILGMFVPLYENACYSFDENIHIHHKTIKAPEFKDVQTLYLTFDFNIGQMSWIVVVRTQNCWHAIRESPMGVMDTPEACNRFIEAFPPELFKNYEVLVYGDASGYQRHPSQHFGVDYEIIRTTLKRFYPRLRIMARTANPHVTTRITATNRQFNKKQLLISRDCPYTIQSANQCAYDQKGGILKPHGETWTHRMDALSYLISQECPIIEPGFGGVSW